MTPGMIQTKAGRSIPADVPACFFIASIHFPLFASHDRLCMYRQSCDLPGKQNAAGEKRIGASFFNVSLDILLKSVLHNSPDSRLRIHCGEEFVAQQSVIAGLPQSSVYPLVGDLPGAGLMTARSIRHMDMAKGVSIASDRLAETALVQLHMVHVVQHPQS